MAQSTNDAFPTAIHIATLNALEGLLQTMGYMHDVFELKAEQFDHVIKMGVHIYKTLCQFVLDKNLKHTRVLERDMKRIQQSRQHLYEVIWEQPVQV